MKKIIALILCVGMILSSVSSFAAVNESYKAVLEIVKTRIPDTLDFDDFSASQNNSRGVKTFNFSWRNSADKTNMEVECLENGIITRFNLSSNENYQEKAMSSLSKDEALEKAKKAFYKLNPDLKDKTIIENGNQNKQLWETRQNFIVSRIENGIEVYGDTGHIEMDMNADIILWYYLNWNDYKDFVNPEKSISLDDAKKIFSEKLGLHLIYKSKIEDGKIKPYLVYTIKDNDYTYVDYRGEIIKCNPYPIYMGLGSATNDKLMLQNATDQYSKAEILEMEKLDGMLSQSEIEEIVQSEKILGLEGFKLDYVSVSRDYYDNEKYTYSLKYAKDKVTANVSVDAKSGEITNYSKYNNIETETVLTETDAQKTLEKAVKSLCATNFDEYELVKNDEYSVEYNRIVNGLKFPHDAIRATVNKYTGELAYYSKTYSNVDFPSKENVVSLNMIYKCAFEIFSYKLKYVPSYSVESEKADLKLVFAFDSESFDIDPFSGEKYRYNGEQETLEYEDINNHYAQEYIEELASYGIGIGNTNFMPDTAIKQKELISLLVKVFYRYYSTFSYSDEEFDENYEFALREGIIKQQEINKDALVTRKDAAKYLVNAMGYEKIAKEENIFASPFSDVTENKGSITILYGLKIVNGDEKGNFNPHDNLTRADTMILLYKTLNA